MDIKTKLYITKVFDHNLVAIYKSKVTLTLNKPAHLGICILDLSKVLMYEFHYDFVKNKYGNNSRLLFIDTGSVMYKIKTENIYEDIIKYKEMLDFRDYSAESKYYDDLNKLIVGKMKDETGGVSEFVELKLQMDSFLVDDNCEHKKKTEDKNVVATISHSEYKNVLLNNKIFKHLMNRIQSKNHKIGTYKINKISLPCFDDKIYIRNNRYDGF